MAEKTLKQHCEELSGVRKSAVISLCLPKEQSLLPKHLLQVQKCLEDKSLDLVDIIIHSSGGNINTAYQIAELIRMHAKKVTVFVPLYAKSAATLLTIAADEIVMGELAELGPLDTQIAEREKGGLRFNSALNPFKSLEQIQRFSLETMDVAIKLILGRAALTVDEAISRGIEFASKVSAPLYAKLDIEKLGEYSRALAIGKEYGDRLLKRYTKWTNDDDRAAVLELLVHAYPSHDYIIDFFELRDLGFNVRMPINTEKPLVDSMAKVLHTLADTEIFCVQKTENPVKEKRGKKDETEVSESKR